MAASSDKENCAGEENVQPTDAEIESPPKRFRLQHDPSPEEGVGSGCSKKRVEDAASDSFSTPTKKDADDARKAEGKKNDAVCPEFRSPSPRMERRSRVMGELSPPNDESGTNDEPRPKSRAQELREWQEQNKRKRVSVGKDARKNLKAAMTLASSSSSYRGGSRSVGPHTASGSKRQPPMPEYILVRRQRGVSGSACGPTARQKSADKPASATAENSKRRQSLPKTNNYYYNNFKSQASQASQASSGSIRGGGGLRRTNSSRSLASQTSSGSNPGGGKTSAGSAKCPKCPRNKQGEDSMAQQRLRDEIKELQARNEQLEGKATASDLAHAEAEAKAAGETTRRILCEEALAASQIQLQALQEDVRQKETMLAQSNSRVMELEKERKHLHNLVQELKGNIRVFVRLRPLLGSDASASSCIQFPQNDPDRRKLRVSADAADTSCSRTQSVWDFEFDKVFPSYASQSDVYKEIDLLVQSVLDGYKVVVFAYGQTGSGKTYTMEGDGSDERDAGMVQRAVQRLFAEVDLMRCEMEGKWEWSVTATNMEIYNESIRDLLSPTENKNVACPADTAKHEIKHSKDGQTTVTGLTSEVVSKAEDISSLISRAKSSRTVAATKYNDVSSRSHSIFSLNVQGRSALTDESRKGVLTMIDLAGSERLDKSGVIGQQAKEAVNINKSLSALGDVISALGNNKNGKRHIPFRNSRLTYLLQNTLGGDAKCLMLVNLSPCKESMQESLCSLRFAAKVNSCVNRALRK